MAAFHPQALARNKAVQLTFTNKLKTEMASPRGGCSLHAIIGDLPNPESLTISLLTDLKGGAGPGRRCRRRDADGYGRDDRAPRKVGTVAEFQDPIDSGLDGDNLV
jgi:hypothetical protein